MENKIIWLVVLVVLVDRWLVVLVDWWTDDAQYRDYMQIRSYNK